MDNASPLPTSDEDTHVVASYDGASHDSVIVRISDENVPIGVDRDATWKGERVAVTSHTRARDGLACRSWGRGWTALDSMIELVRNHVVPTSVNGNVKGVIQLIGTTARLTRSGNGFASGPGRGSRTELDAMVERVCNEQVPVRIQRNGIREEELGGTRPSSPRARHRLATGNRRRRNAAHGDSKCRQSSTHPRCPAPRRRARSPRGRHYPSSQCLPTLRMRTLVQDTARCDDCKNQR